MGEITGGTEGGIEEDIGVGEEIAEDGGIEDGGIDDGGSEEGRGSEERGPWDELMTLVMMLVTTLVEVSIWEEVTGGGSEVTVGGTCTDVGDSDIQNVVVQQREGAQEKLGAIHIRF